MAINPLQYSGVVAPRDLDFSSLAQLPQQYRQGQARQTLANLQRGPDGQIDTAPLYASGDLSLANLAKEIDRNKSIEGRDARDFQFRQQQAQLGQRNADRSHGLQVKIAQRGDTPAPLRVLEAAGIDPKSAEGHKALFPRTDTPVSAGDKKTITAAEDELPNIMGTIDALKTAKELNTKTFTGMTAGARGFIGTAVPGGSYLVDKDAALATSEFGKVMSGEAIKTMADTLKGATTDFELKKFETMLADPTTPPEIRGRVIDRMLTLAERQKAIKERRIKDLRGGTYFKPEGAGAASLPRTTGPTSETRQIPQAAIEALRSDPNLKEQFEAKYGKGSAGVVLR
jgi:hypothetical protein